MFSFLFWIFLFFGSHDHLQPWCHTIFQSFFLTWKIV